MENNLQVLENSLSVERNVLVKTDNDIIEYTSKLLDLKEEWNEFIKDHPIMLEIKEIEDYLEILKSKKEDIEQEIIHTMIENNCKKVQIAGVDFSLKNTGRPSVIVEDESLVPKEYTRTKVEVDKKAILEAYKTSGILVQGTDVKDEPNYKLTVKISKK